MMMKQEQTYREFQHSVAMTVTLISFGMLFATLFLGYLLVRFNSPSWPPVEIEGMPQGLPFISTLVMALSSLSYVLMQNTSGSKARLAWLVTTVLGLVFLGVQYLLWTELKARGILVSNGMAPSMVYGFTWLHAAHILLGLAALLWLGHYLWRGKASAMMLVNVGKFWHFLGVVWLVMYLTLFVI
jgi:cytochrome c oxidase subunit 3